MEDTNERPSEGIADVAPVEEAGPEPAGEGGPAGTDITSRRRAAAGRLRLVLNILLFLIVILHPTQDSVNVTELLARGHGEAAEDPAGQAETKTAERKLPAINVTVADLLLGVAFLVWMALLWSERGRGRRGETSERAPAAWRLVPLPVFLLALWMILSLAPALKPELSEDQAFRLSLAAGLKGLAQFIEYFLVGYLFFTGNVRTRRLLAAVALTLAAVTTAVIGCAWYQYVMTGRGGIPAMKVAARFGNRNVLGCYFALALPAMWGMGLWARNWACRAWLILAVLAGLSVTLAGGAFVAVCVAILVLAYMRHWAAFVVTAGVLMVGCLVGMGYLPRENAKILADSVMLYKERDPYRTLKPDVSEMSKKTKHLEACIRGLKRSEGRDPAYFERLRRKMADAPGGQENIRPKEVFGWPWQQRYKDWQAGLRMMAKSPVFGLGLGNHEKNFNRFYEPMPKYPEDLMEPDADNFYMLLGAEAGVPALLLWLWVLLHFGRKAVALFSSCANPLLRGLGAGVLGSLVALSINSLFTSVFVRGVGVTLVILLALVSCRASSEEEDAVSSLPSEN